MNLPSPNPETLRRQINDLDHQLETALLQAGNGQRIDIKPFQRSASLFCDHVVKLPANEARTFQSAIADLIRKLDALEAALAKSSA